MSQIVRDRQRLLDDVVEHRPLLTKTLLLAIQIAPEINAQLFRPIRIGLQRPQQKSFPRLAACSFCCVEEKGLKFL